MRQWAIKFWAEYGDGLVFLISAMVLAGLFFAFVPSLKKEVTGILLGGIMLLFNKARGLSRKNEPKEPVK